MRRWLTRGSIVLLVLLMMAVVVGQATTTASSGRYRVGETIQFKVQNTTSGWWWGNCCCQCTCSETQILGWHIANSSGQTVYMVVHDAPVAASIWQGNWAQIDSVGAAIPVGEYMLYVDTSVGTLSRSFKLYDPCSCCGWCCNWYWNCNWCNETSTITTNCYCRTSLVLLEEAQDCCWPFFRWSCNPCCP